MNIPFLPPRTSGSVRAPVLCLIAALCGAGAIFVVFQKEKAALQTQIAELREQVRQTEARAADPKEVERLRAQAREAAELKKEAEEVHRLRGEVTLLRKDKAVFEKASAENTQLREQVQQAQRLQAENNVLRGQGQTAQQSLTETNASGRIIATIEVGQANDLCILNMKRIDGATQQWALEARKAATSLVELKGILPYLKGSVLPVCPSGGTYTFTTVSVDPFCSVHGRLE